MEASWILIAISIILAASSKYVVKVLNLFWFQPRKLEKLLRKQGFDGNRYRPILGDLKEFIRTTKEEQARSIELSDDISQHIYPYDKKNAAKYGRTYFFWIGPYPRLSIMDPELIKEILLKNDVIHKNKGRFFTGGIVNLEDEEWTRRRKIVNPAFHMEKLKNMVRLIGLSCSEMTNKWEAMVTSSKEGSCAIDVWPYLKEFTCDVISRTALGSTREEGRKIFELQKEKVKLGLQLMELSFVPGWRYLPTKANKKLKAITMEINSTLKRVVDRRLKANGCGDDNSGGDLLGILLESNLSFMNEEGNKNVGMSIQDVVEECQLFYSAGAETISSLLVWTMVMLCKYPEWQTRAREEVIQVFGNSEPTYERFNQLKTVTMILHETLRLYPPTPQIGRHTKETVQLGNLTIPAGVYLILPLGLLHHDPKVWGDDAKEFKPQRFAGGVSNATTIQSTFVPFGSGPRICIGMNFAMIEAKIALAKILHRFSFELSPSYVHAPVAVANMFPYYGAPLILRNL